jgi:phage baseplate assembly protein W
MLTDADVCCQRQVGDGTGAGGVVQSVANLLVTPLGKVCHTSAYVSIHTSAYVSLRQRVANLLVTPLGQGVSVARGLSRRVLTYADVC